MKIGEVTLETIWSDLRLFERKILYGIGRHITKNCSKSKAYTIHLTEFCLDNLNPSDIIERLISLKEKTIPVRFEDFLANVRLLTDVRYDDGAKTVTLTFNRLLEAPYRELPELKKVEFQLSDCLKYKVRH